MMKISQKTKKKIGKAYRSTLIKSNASKPETLCHSAMKNLLMTPSRMEIYRYYLENIHLLINRLLKESRKPKIYFSRILFPDSLDLHTYLLLPSLPSESTKKKQ